jgi:RNA polymerase sigma-70 factor (ECF subfamily)
MTDSILPFRRAQASDVSDEALIRACALGDNLAMQSLFQRHVDRVHRILVRVRYVDRRDLDDLIQMTFIEVQRSAKGFDARASVGTWIVGIALNVARQFRRSELRRRAAMLDLATFPQFESGLSPYEQAAKQQQLVCLQRGFEALPRKLRIVFTLCDLEGMRGVEVARALNIPEGTVWSRLNLAREHLRRHVNPGGRR